MTLEIVDLFCGAGGTSTGILQACDQECKPVNLTAVNHWKTAISTHSLNHPSVRHICEPVENLQPLDHCRTGRLSLLAASCECRYHSNARGGGPCNDQSRSQAWQIVHWATAVKVERIMMENVKEFQHWGPLNPRTLKPIKSKRGTTFRTFITSLQNLGYKVEWKIQNAADFGDPTRRYRLILQARLDGKISWPEPSHGPGRTSAWRTARECIDWSIKGTSIFNRKKPLSENTTRRIIAGLKKFCGSAAEPFIVVLRGTSESQLKYTCKTVDEPLPSITSGGRHFHLVEPFIMSYHGSHDGKTDGDNRNHPTSEPIPTIDTSNRYALVEPFLVQTDNVGFGDSAPKSLNSPVPTIVTKQNLLLIEPFLTKYYSTGIGAKPVNVPLDTVTTKQRFALVEPVSDKTGIDIRIRMLQPHELAAAHSFPSDYQFTGNKEDQTKQVGNSVPVKLARAHAHSILFS